MTILATRKVVDCRTYDVKDFASGSPGSVVEESKK
jgi:hypothetical protein